MAHICVDETIVWVYLLPRHSALKSGGLEGRLTSLEAHSASGSEVGIRDSHNLFVPCKGHSKRNGEGQRLSDVRVTRGVVQPGKLRMSNSGSRAGGGRRLNEGGCYDGGDRTFWDLGLWNFNVCLPAYTPLSLAGLLIPGFGDVKSFFHLFPCQLCSRYLQPSARFRFR